MTDLYIRPGTSPQPLPFEAYDAEGRIWTDLTNSDEGREATGWSEAAPEKPAYNPALQTVIWAENGWRVNDLPPPEPPAREPKILGKLEFIGLAQIAGGMTDEQLVTAYKDVRLEAFWVKYQMASQVVRDHDVTTTAIGALDALGYLPNGSEAVIAAWPTQ